MVRLTTLNDGSSFPLIGLGLMGIASEKILPVMREAVEIGYRNFDTAPIYGNEKGVGRGLAECGLPRHEVSVTTKLWNDRQGYDETLRAFDESVAALAVDYIDVYLIHWPVPARNRYLDSWRALVRLKEEGRVRSVGVSNFLPEQLQRIIGETGVAPALNQIELHPAWQQTALREVHAAHDIVTQAWSPLGQGAATDNPAIIAAAQRIGCSAAQLILAYLASRNIIVIPKASSAAHLKENFASIDIHLDEVAIDAMKACDKLDGRFGPDPMSFENIPTRA